MKERGKVTTVLGMEKDLKYDKFEYLDLEVMSAEEKAAIVTTILTAPLLWFATRGISPEAVLNDITLSDGNIDENIDPDMYREDRTV